MPRLHCSCYVALELWLFAVAADPGVGPIRRSAWLAFRQEVGPGVANDQGRRFPRQISNWPSAWTSPISTGLERWWLAFMTASEPVGERTCLAIHGLTHGVDVGRAGLLDRLHPHLEADARALPSGHW